MAIQAICVPDERYESYRNPDRVVIIPYEIRRFPEMEVTSSGIGCIDTMVFCTQNMDKYHDQHGMKLPIMSE